MTSFYCCVKLIYSHNKHTDAFVKITDNKNLTIFVIFGLLALGGNFRPHFVKQINLGNMIIASGIAIPINRQSI